MALTLGVNSFTDVASLDAYFVDRLDATAITGASPSEKAAALVSATDILNELSWVGAAVDSSQPLAFPRRGSYFDPRAGGRLMLSGIPDRITKATYELALHLLENENLRSETGSVSGLSISSINIQSIKQAPKIPARVYNIIRPLLVNQGASSWWRAN